MALLDSYALEGEPAPESGPVRIGRHTYVRAPGPIEFRSEEPLEEAVTETKRHLEARTTLYLLLKHALTEDALGSDQFVYFDAADPRRCLSPDVFVKRGSGLCDFDVWKTWKAGAPDLAVEIVSASDRRDDDWEEKLGRYRASGIGEVVRFDPADVSNPVRVWDRVEDDLLEREPRSTLLRECATLGLWWVVVPAELGPQLRLARDREGKELLATPGEAEERLAAELAEERRARAEAEHERVVAEHERIEAERARIEAESARVVAEHVRTMEAAARREAEQKAMAEAEARQREVEARQREAEARAAAERERDAALAELAKLRARPARKSRTPR